MKDQSGSGSFRFLHQAGVMAEYGHTGLLAAVLLFTALTVRDIYLGSSSPQGGHQPPDGSALSPNTEAGKPGKATLYSGPVLRFQYW